MNRLILISYLSLYSLLAFADSTTTAQDPALIRNTVTTFIEQQSSDLPGSVNFKVGNVDPRITLPACNKLEAFLASGSQLIGNTSIGVRCTGTQAWKIFIPAQIKISLNLLVSARQLPMGHTLQQQDLTRQITEASQMIGYTDPTQVIGKVLRYGISSGQIVREEMLRPPYSVAQGKIAQLITSGNGFNVRSEGTALNNASEGEMVQIRVSAGRVVSGIARPNGIVEVAH